MSYVSPSKSSDSDRWRSSKRDKEDEVVILDRLHAARFLLNDVQRASQMVDVGVRRGVEGSAW